jgi:hypothetical protein
MAKLLVKQVVQNQLSYSKRGLEAEAYVRWDKL